MIKVLLAVLALGFSLNSMAAARNCAAAAKLSVEKADPFNPQKVTAMSPAKGAYAKAVHGMIEKANARQLGISPGQKTQILNDLKNGTTEVNYYLVQAGNTFYLAMTNSVSCAPYNPIKLN